MTIARAVVGYDGSDEANAAAAFGLWLAAKAGVRTTVVHACPTPEAAATADVLAAGASEAMAYRSTWERRLGNIIDYAVPGAPVDARLVRGGAAGALVAAAAEAHADLVLAGSHGTGHVRGALMGSVAAQLLSHAPCSVLLFGDGAAGSAAADATTVIAGLDGTPSAEHALRQAEALAAALGARLLLAHAVELHTPPLPSPTAAVRTELQRDARHALHEARQSVTALDAVDEEVLEGRARHALVAACDRHAPALLVVGSRGRGGFEQLLLGSTSRWVANHAPCPVLVARKPR